MFDGIPDVNLPPRGTGGKDVPRDWVELHLQDGGRMLGVFGDVSRGHVGWFLM